MAVVVERHILAVADDGAKVVGVGFAEVFQFFFEGPAFKKLDPILVVEPQEAPAAGDVEADLRRVDSEEAGADVGGRIHAERVAVVGNFFDGSSSVTAGGKIYTAIFETGAAHGKHAVAGHNIVGCR